MVRFSRFFKIIAALLVVLVLSACQTTASTPPTAKPAAQNETLEQNKALARRVLEEAASQQKPELLDELFASDYVLHDPANPMVHDRETFKQFLGGHYTAFPDVKWTIEDVVAEGDRVVVRWTLTGTHKGPLLGIPPTGKQVKMWGISIYRIADGKIAEEWGRGRCDGYDAAVGRDSTAGAAAGQVGPG
jgi:steroid delta-isomerase-like uncharacterized protein